MWLLFMDLPKEKQDPEVFLSLPQNIHECFQHLAITDRLQVITNTLGIYLHGKHTMAYIYQGFLFLQKDSRSEYKLCFGTV